MPKTKVLSVTASDCRWDYYRGSGAGGQKRNKTSNCVRCTHIASGAVGKSEDGRSQIHNKRTAFVRMTKTKEFKSWLRVESARACGDIDAMMFEIERSFGKNTIKVEKFKNGRWVAE